MGNTESIISGMGHGRILNHDVYDVRGRTESDPIHLLSKRMLETNKTFSLRGDRTTSHITFTEDYKETSSSMPDNSNRLTFENDYISECSIESTLDAVISELSNPKKKYFSCKVKNSIRISEDELRWRSKSENDLSVSHVRTGTSYKKFRIKLGDRCNEQKFAKHVLLDGTDKIYKAPSSVPRFDSPGANNSPALPPKHNTNHLTYEEETDGKPTTRIESCSLNPHEGLVEDEMSFLSSDEYESYPQIIVEDSTVYQTPIYDFTADMENVDPEYEESSDYLTPINSLKGHNDNKHSNSKYEIPSSVPRLDFQGADDSPELPSKRYLIPSFITSLDSTQRSKSENDLSCSLVRVGTSYKKFRGLTGCQSSENKFAKHIKVDGSDSIYKVPSNVPRPDHPDADNGPELPPKKTFPRCKFLADYALRCKSENDLTDPCRKDEKNQPIKYSYSDLSSDKRRFHLYTLKPNKSQQTIIDDDLDFLDGRTSIIV